MYYMIAFINVLKWQDYRNEEQINDDCVKEGWGQRVLSVAIKEQFERS
jgi:hypothetical protein